MKPLLTLLALLACTIALRADPMAEVKRVMDEPVVLRYVPDRSNPVRDAARDRAEIARATGISVKDVESDRGVKIAPRAFFALLAKTQGATSSDMRTLGYLAATNAQMLRARLTSPLKDAGLAGAATELGTALESIEASKTLDRAAQDRFARLARIAP